MTAALRILRPKPPLAKALLSGQPGPHPGLARVGIARSEPLNKTEERERERHVTLGPEQNKDTRILL